MSKERFMSPRVQSKAALRGNNHAAVVAIEDDRWVWGVIFTIAALSGLCLAALFSVTIG
jgi:hypothetical protein